ncbi:unannotated protein [freshwater metagenome]|uniref:Unannotated protein n=1 Tax=freshwater metagenome TaxID=449393 RepID=A0A6J6W668_9ZZZZ
MASKKKIITVAVTTVALSLGSVGIATASNSKSKVAVTKISAKATGFAMAGRGIGGPEKDVATVLSALVTKGTITQAQADAIAAALIASRDANKPPMSAQQSAHETLIATTLGIDVATLETRLRAGDSLATIAGSKTAALITVLVADQTKQIDAAVTAGKITAAQATTLKSKLTASITAMVNKTGAPKGGPMGGHMGGRMGDMDGDHGPMMGGLAPVIPTT